MDEIKKRVISHKFCPWIITKPIDRLWACGGKRLSFLATMQSMGQTFRHCQQNKIHGFSLGTGRARTPIFYFFGWKSTPIITIIPWEAQAQWNHTAPLGIWGCDVSVPIIAAMFDLLTRFTTNLSSIFTVNKKKRGIGVVCFRSSFKDQLAQKAPYFAWRGKGWAPNKASSMTEHTKPLRCVTLLLYGLWFSVPLALAHLLWLL